MDAEKYLVFSSGKKQDKEYSFLRKVIEGTKKNGDTFSFLDDKSFQREEERLPVGTIIRYQRQRVPDGGFGAKK